MTVTGIYISEKSAFTATSIPASATLLDRYTGRVMKLLHQHRNPGRRGNIVASDYIVSALLRQQSDVEYRLVVRPWLRQAVTKYLSLEQLHSSAQVLTTEQIRLNGADKCGIHNWFTPLPLSTATEGIELTTRIRQTSSTRVLPFTMLLHGLSHPSMLIDVYLRLMLERSYACDALVTSSHASKKALESLMSSVAEAAATEYNINPAFEGHIEVIPLAVDTDHFKPLEKSLARRTFKLPQHGFVLLYIGKLSALKADLMPTLEMLPELKANNKGPVILVLAGEDEGGYSNLIVELAHALGIEKRVLIFNNVADCDKPLLLAAADVFISPSDSLQESFGLTPIEAMSCGIPQVVADWNGYRETVEHQITGFRVPTYWTKCDGDLRDAGAISSWALDHLAMGQSVAIDMVATRSYIQMLIDNPELVQRMSTASRQRAVSMYSYRTIAQQYEELWCRQRERAARISVTKSTMLLGQPSYSTHFKHYCTFFLNDEAELSLTATAASRLLKAPINNGPATLMQALSTIDDALIEEILQYMRSRLGGGRSVSLGQIVAQLQTSTSADCIRRHVMWLIKYGFLRPEQAHGEISAHSK